MIKVGDNKLELPHPIAYITFDLFMVFKTRGMSVLER